MKYIKKTDAFFFNLTDSSIMKVSNTIFQTQFQILIILVDITTGTNERNFENEYYCQVREVEDTEFPTGLYSNFYMEIVLFMTATLRHHCYLNEIHCTSIPNKITKITLTKFQYLIHHFL